MDRECEETDNINVWREWMGNLENVVFESGKSNFRKLNEKWEMLTYGAHRCEDRTLYVTIWTSSLVLLVILSLSLSVQRYFWILDPMCGVSGEEQRNWMSSSAFLSQSLSYGPDYRTGGWSALSLSAFESTMFTVCFGHDRRYPSWLSIRKVTLTELLEHLTALPILPSSKLSWLVKWLAKSDEGPRFERAFGRFFPALQAAPRFEYVLQIWAPTNRFLVIRNTDRCPLSGKYHRGLHDTAFSMIRIASRKDSSSERFPWTWHDTDSSWGCAQLGFVHKCHHVHFWVIFRSRSGS